MIKVHCKSMLFQGGFFYCVMVVLKGGAVYCVIVVFGGGVGFDWFDRVLVHVEIYLAVNTVT